MGMHTHEIREKCLDKCEYHELQPITGSDFKCDICTLSGVPVECSTIKSCNRPSRAWVRWEK